MELLSKVALVAIILIVIAVSVGVLLKHVSQPSNITASYAKNFVLTDLHQSTPSGEFTVLNVSGGPNSWTVLVAASYNTTTPCPTYFTESFNYPSTNLAPTIDNIYISNCTVRQIPSSSGGDITLPVIAIGEATEQARSGGDPLLLNYLQTYPFGSTSVKADLYSTYNSILEGTRVTGSNIWIVNYTSTDANFSVYAILNSTGYLERGVI
jgi:hypothetical protein